METIDLTVFYNKIINVWDEERYKNRSHIAFKLKERVPLGALNFKWMETTRYHHSESGVNLRNATDKYPVGINYNFALKNCIYPYKYSSLFDSIPSNRLLHKINAGMSYVTMPFLHENGLLNIQDTVVNNNYGVFINQNGLAAFVEIPYDVYITALHIFNAINSVTDIEALKGHPYLTTDDVSKLEIPIEDVRIVKEKDVDLSFGFFGRAPIEIIEVDDIYEYLTGNKIEQEPFKLFEYE